MTVPRYFEFFNPILQALQSLGRSASIRELDNAVISLMGLSDEDLAQPHGDRGSEVAYRLAWARTYLKAVGLLDNSGRGIWSLTPLGTETSAVNPQEVVRRVREQTVGKGRKRKAEAKTIPVDDSELQQEAAADRWRSELLSRVQRLSPAGFERLAQRLLREAGFVQVEVTGRSGDGGIDGIGVVRLGGLLGFPIMFQCKRYKGTVSSSAIRDFRGAVIGRADRGLMITTGTYSRDARTEATRDGALPIDLLDGEELVEKLKELRLGVNVEMIESVSVETNWFDSLE